MNEWLDKTFADALQWAAQTHGDREALRHGDASLTYAQLLARVNAFARGLIELGVRQGDHVSVWMPDGLPFMVARWAIPSIGAVFVPINTRFRDQDVGFVLAQSDSALLIVSEGFGQVSYFDILERIVPSFRQQPRERWQADSLPRLRQVIGHGSHLPASVYPMAEVEALGAGLPDRDRVLQERRAAIKSTDVAQILYTSGTTSFPKGAMVRHGALLQNNYHTLHCLNLTPEDRYLSSVPLFSATGTSYTLSMLLSGAAIVMMDRFSPEAFCQTVERERITVTFFVEAMVQDLKAFAERTRYDLSTLRTGTGAPISAESARWVIEELGVREFTSVFGMSETSNSMTRAPWYDTAEHRIHTNGRANPGVHLRIVDLDTQRPVPPGTVGEICIRGFSVMEGYYNLPEENARVFDAEGWFHGGDLGELTAEGYLIYRGRIKEMIKPGGFNVATSEIESFVRSRADVREVVVVGVPDERLGEVAFAFVQPEPGGKVSEPEIIEHCRQHIAAFKVPRYVQFIEDWPMTPTGKIKRLFLREEALQWLEHQRQRAGTS